MLGMLAPYDQWSAVQAYNVSFGQGVSVTPLQMTRFYGAIVNNGVECVPHFLIGMPQNGHHARLRHHPGHREHRCPR